MKKFWFRLAIMLVGFCGITVANNVVLLNLHPLAYYYTPSGLMLNAIVMTVEAAILWPVSGWYCRKYLLSALSDGATDEIKEIVTESKEL